MPSQSDPTPQVTVRNIPQDSYNQNVAAGSAGPAGPSAPLAGGGIKGHLARNWPIYALVLGVVTIIVMVMINRNNANNNTLANNMGGTSGTLGQAPDQLYGSQLDADLQQLMSFQNQQLGILNQIQNGLQNPSTNPPPVTIPGPGTRDVQPAPKGTPGLSDNFWVYTTKLGDTAFSVNKFAGWSASGPGFFENYRNNMDVLHAAGYDTSNPYAALPVGTKVSL